MEHMVGKKMMIRPFETWKSIWYGPRTRGFITQHTWGDLVSKLTVAPSHSNQISKNQKKRHFQFYWRSLTIVILW